MATSTPTISVGRHGPEDVARYYADGDWQQRVLYDLVAEHARRIPDRVFVTDGYTTRTYGDLREEAVRLAAGLHRRGVRRGDRVAVQLPNWAEFAVITVALSRLGAILVPIMPIFRHNEVGYILKHSAAVMLIGPETFRDFSYFDMYRELQARLPELRSLALVRGSLGGASGDVSTLDGLMVDGDTDELDASLGDHAGPDDGCLIVYTSGTTARPKGCYHSFNTLYASSIAMINRLRIDEADVFFNPSPVSHSTGLVTGLLMPLIVGGGTHFLDVWTPEEGLRRIADYRCTATYTATTFLATLMHAYDADRHVVSSLRYWVCAGSPIPGSLVQEARSRLGCAVLSLYGRSENMTTTMCGPDDPPERSATSDGRALPGAAVQVVDKEGREVPTEESGDIAYRGPSHMLGYYLDEAQTDLLYTPGGFSRSGDLGFSNAEGFVRVTGRIKDIIIRGGMNISSREIEDLLLQHPAVRDVAVVAMPDPRLGERCCAYVVVAPGAPEPSLDDLTEFLRAQQIAVQKLPERLEIVEELPMTAVGKVRKNVLRDDIAAKLKQEQRVSARC